VAQLTTTYACDDGTPFPVTWERPEDAARAWRWNQEHWPAPLMPFEAAAWRLADPAAERAFAEVGLPAPHLLQRTQFPHGFMFLDRSPPSAEMLARWQAGVRALKDRWGGCRPLWEGHSLPRVRRGCDQLRAAAADAPIGALIEAWGYAWHQTFVSAFPLLLPAVQRLAEVCTELLGPGGELAAHELVGGYDNETLEADQALWELARALAGDAALRSALLDADHAGAVETLGGLPHDAPFSEALGAFLARYGGRTEGWDLATPTWQERPELCLAAIRRVVVEDQPSPRHRLGEAARRRDQRLREIEARLTSEPASLARFREALADVEGYVFVREGRAYWQLTTTGCLRAALLRRGGWLVARGALREPEDVLYLLPDEIEGLSANVRDLSALAASRRAERERWLTLTPPAAIGDVEANAGPPLGEGAEGTPAATATLRGVAASRGRAAGWARIITGLDRADGLQAGDVLVCVMTSPPWTPLFGIAGAVVTDAGSIISHPSIAAREYGIPCVVGTQVATRVIPDGALVTVDGGAGTVTIER
jgi:pyruvate,water dikinase